jgi:hypothetical protein
MELSRTSRGGMRSPYFQFLIRSRVRTIENLKRAGYTPNQMHDYIRKQYIDRGFTKRDKLGRRIIDVWAMVRFYEERAFRRGEQYTSPWRNRIEKKRAKRHDKKHTTRTDMYNSLIREIDRQLPNITNEARRKSLLEQKKNLEERLKNGR